MNFIKIDFTDVQLNNLLTFLNRTSLVGNEVPAYIELLNILQNSNNKDNLK